MARKSPRSRKKARPDGRVPGAHRARKSPRKSTRKKPGRKAEAGTHKLRGARTGAAAPKKAAKKRTSRPSAAAPKKPAAPAGKAAPKRTGRRRGKFTPPDPQRVAHVLAILEGLYPAAMTELEFESPLQLLIATILSAQCTDDRVNMVTPVLFAKFPDARALAAAPQAEVEEIIRSTGFYRNKATSIRACCADIVAKHGGEVPRTMEALVALRGVGRKTANVVIGNAFGIPGLVVDTHVTRLSNRLGFTNEKDAVKIEHALMPIVPEEKWTVFSHWLILHGRRVCNARKPHCSICQLAPHCPRVGVTASQ